MQINLPLTHSCQHLKEVSTDGFGVIVIGFADEPQPVQGQQPTIVSVMAQLLIIGNLLLGECLFYNRPPN